MSSSPPYIRRFFSLLIVIATAAGPLVMSNAASAAPLTPPAVPSTGTYFGSSATVRTGETKQEAILRTESQIGRKLAIDHQFYKWDHTLPTTHESWDVANGRIPFMSWKPQRRDGTSVAWTRINSGVEDAWITAQADRVRDFAHPVFMVFNHEPYDQSKEGWGTPADFVSAWRRIVDTFRARGATNVAWVLVLTGYDYEVSGRAANFYPGDGYVDWLAADPYNWYTRDGYWADLSQKAQAFYTWGSARNKPLMLAEWGSEEDPARPGRKAQWFDNARAWFKNSPNIKALAYFNSTVDHDWYIDTSESSLAAFSAMGADPWFNPQVSSTTTTTAPPTTTTTAPSTTTTTTAPAPTPTTTADPYTPIATFPYSEGSGIVASKTQPGVFWVERDSGNPANLYATRIVDGQLADVVPGSKWKTVTTDATNSDWEDIGIDDSGRVLIHERGSSRTYAFGEVDPASASSTSRQATMAWAWPSNSHDTESLFWWDNSVYIVDKRPCSPHFLYRRSMSTSGTETLADLGEIVAPPVGWVEAGDCAPATGVDVSTDGKRVAVVTERRVWIYEGTNPEDALRRAPKWSVKHRADGSKEQVEAVAFGHNSYDLVTLSETGGRIRYIPGSFYGPAPAPAPESTTTTTTTTAAPTTTTTAAPTTTTTAAPTTTTTAAPTTTTTTAPPAPAPSSRRVYKPTADARVEGNNPSRNYGKSSTVVADGSPTTQTFLRFDVTGVSGPVTRARLRLHVIDPSSNGPEVYPTASTWTETGITYNNRPARTGSLVADIGSVTDGAYAEWDVTGHITGNGTYSLNLAGDSNDGADFKSREASIEQPELVIEAGTSSEPAPEPTPAPAPTSACSASWGTASLVGALGTDRGEMSGLAASSAYPGWGWGIRDSGNPATIYSFRIDSGKVTSGAFPVSGASNSDWEDIAYTPSSSGPGTLWVLDNKGNSYTGNRVIYKIAEPNPATPTSVTILGRYDWAYPGGTQYNTEVLFSFNGRLAVISKTSPSRVYLFSGALQAGVVNKPVYVGNLAEGSNLSVGALSADGRILAVASHYDLRVYQNKGDASSLADLIAGAPVFRQTMAQDNREGGSFFPYGSCNLTLVAESKNVWQLTSR